MSKIKPFGFFFIVACFSGLLITAAWGGLHDENPSINMAFYVVKAGVTVLLGALPFALTYLLFYDSDNLGDFSRELTEPQEFGE